MEIESELVKFLEIFAPDYLSEVLEISAKSQRFAYYTSAETAIKVLSKGELWFRNATVMNDFAEISYGLDLINEVFAGPAGERFREAVDDIADGTIKQVDESLNGWMSDWRLETYLACISLHDESEDRMGRLSMWRAYGNTALVVNSHPMIAVTDLLGVYSLPVRYHDAEHYAAYLNGVTDRVLINRRELQALGQPTLIAYVHDMLFRTAIASKHPGFSEEKEWRLYHRPNEHVSKLMKTQVEVLGGVPQQVYVLPLRDAPDNGLFGADIPTLLDRVIIGPTEYSYVSSQAFIRVLAAANVVDPQKKVFVSDVPLRR